jgi:hypothetical protein
MATDDTHLLKWRRSLRKKAINILALLENKKVPCPEIDKEIREAVHCNHMWKEQGEWEKNTETVPLPEPKDLHFQATDE